MSHIPRIDLEIRLNSGRNWLLETYTALGDEAMGAPATRDEHDPDVWWTPKDHFAHASELVRSNTSIVRGIFSPDAEPFVLNENALADLHVRTHEIWERNHDLSVSEIVAMGQRVRAEQMALLGDLTDEQLMSPTPLGGITVVQLMLLNLGHDRLHLRWALDGLAERGKAAASGQRTQSTGASGSGS